MGGLGNFGLQMVLSMYYGDMGFWQAIRCVNWSSVANGAAFGAVGGLPVGMVGKGVLAGSGKGIAKGLGVGALSTYTAIGLPRIAIDDECDCKFGDAPAWVTYAKTLF
jgi:hypothetical protein